MVVEIVRKGMGTSRHSRMESLRASPSSSPHMPRHDVRMQLVIQVRRQSVPVRSRSPHECANLVWADI